MATSVEKLDAEQLRALPFPPVWLRDNCSCGSCRDPRSGQKLFAIAEIPSDLRVAAIEESAHNITVVFAPDGHRSEFSRDWLSAAAQLGRHVGDGRTESEKTLWSTADFDAVPSCTWSAYLRDDTIRARNLRQIQEIGFLLLRDVPCVDEAVLTVATTFGYVRETNYGRLFDVRVVAAPNNLAFTSQAITPHTDNPYRDPVPTMQLLHCLQNAAAGGETGLVDGFKAAATLRMEEPEAFEVLTRTSVTFAFSSEDAELRADRPIIETDGAGRIRGIRFNNRSMQPLALPYDEAVDFYRAYRLFADYLNRPQAQLDLRLDAGDCLIFDNTRILHARTAFADADHHLGRRHLQGCYADLDALASEIAVLERR
jgi:gamma-butyrobetaine dioxygenase